MDDDSVYPNIKVEYIFADFINGIDPIMREILKLN